MSMRVWNPCKGLDLCMIEKQIIMNEWTWIPMRSRRHSNALWLHNESLELVCDFSCITEYDHNMISSNPTHSHSKFDVKLCMKSPNRNILWSYHMLSYDYGEYTFIFTLTLIYNGFYSYAIISLRCINILQVDIILWILPAYRRFTSFGGEFSKTLRLRLWPNFISEFTAPLLCKRHIQRRFITSFHFIVFFIYAQGFYCEFVRFCNQISSLQLHCLLFFLVQKQLLISKILYANHLYQVKQSQPK